MGKEYNDVFSISCTNRNGLECDVNAGNHYIETEVSVDDYIIEGDVYTDGNRNRMYVEMGNGTCNVHESDITEGKQILECEV